MQPWISVFEYDDVISQVEQVTYFRYSERTQMSELVEVSVSKASAKQRCGRAGRVQQGVCFRLYTRPVYDHLLKYSVPEMLRVPLEELCLHIMVCIMHIYLFINATTVLC